MENFLYPTHPVRCIITGPSNIGKSVFLTNLILNIIEYDKIYIYSPSLQQDLYQKLIKCFSNYIPIHIIPNVLNEDIDLVIDEIVFIINFIIVFIIDSEKSDSEIETYESIQELKYPQEYNSDQSVAIILDDLNEWSRVQAMFKRSRHKNISILQ